MPVVEAVRPSAACLTFNALGGLHKLKTERVHAFWRNVERFGPGAQLRCDNGASLKRCVILSGWASEMRILADGRRQIFSFLLPGDAFLLEERADLGGRGVIALTRLEVMDAAHPALGEAETRESLSQAMREAAIQKEERLLDHMVRIGRLNARERVLHLLLELCERLESVGLVKDDTFRIPLTQEIFADALGLSLVHINRTLQHLRREGHIVLKRGAVTLPHRQKLASLAFYHPAAV